MSQLGPCFTWSTFPCLAANFNKPTVIDWVFFSYSLNTPKPSKSCLTQKIHYIGNAQPILQLIWWFSLFKTDMAHPPYHLHVCSSNSANVTFLQWPGFAAILHDTSDSNWRQLSFCIMQKFSICKKRQKHPKLFPTWPNAGYWTCLSTSTCTQHFTKIRKLVKNPMLNIAKSNLFTIIICNKLGLSRFCIWNR